MPFSRRRTFRRRRRSTRSRGRRPRRMPLRRSIRLDPEVKTRDLVITFRPFGGTPFIFSLSQLNQGVDDNDRIGNQAVFKSFQMKMNIPIGGAGVTQIRYMLLVDTMPDGNDIVAADIFADANLPMTSPLNMSNNKRLKVMINRVLSFSIGEIPVKLITLYKRLNLVVRYNGGGAGGGAVRSNQHYFCLFNEVATGIASDCQMYFRSRFIG